MRKYVVISCLLLTAISSQISYAAQDPVSWSLNPATGFPVTAVGTQSVITYTLTSHLPGPAVIIDSFQINGPGITVEDNCNNHTLNLNGTCTVVVTFTPTTAGNTSFQFIYGYNNNRIPVPQLSASATGSLPRYSLSGSIPNFPASILPTQTVLFTAEFFNSGEAQLTNCYAGDSNGSNQFILTPSNAANLQVTGNTCGTAGSLINLNTTSPGNTCTVSGSLSAPYQTGEFTLAAIMHCSQASSEPTVSSTVEQSSPGLTGSITSPTPFPAIFYDNEAPYITATFTNTGNVTLTNCQAATTTGFTLNPSSAATLVAGSQASTCGSAGTPTTLNPTQICYLYGQMTDLIVTPSVSLTGTVNCTQASATTPAKTFAIDHNSGSCSTITVQPTLLLPTSTYQYADNVVQFKVTNSCSPPQSVVLGTVAITPTSGAATITTNPTWDLCSNNTLAAGSSCLVTASVIPTSTTSPLTIQAAVTPTSPSGGVQATATTTATTVNSNNQATHHILFVNQCNFDVWYGIGNAAGTSGAASPDPNLVTYPSGAPDSAYHLPALVSGQAPSTIDLAVSVYENGAIWPRTGCSNQGGQLVCATGTCTTLSNSGYPVSGTCVSGASTGNMPLNPITKIEETLVTTAGADGVYDVSVINGMTVPVEMKAFGPLGANEIGSSPGSASDVYTCSSAGAIIQPNASSLLYPCSWSFSPSTYLTGVTGADNDFYWVTPGADDGCTASAAPQLCGMAYDVAPPANPAKTVRTLGDFLGFSTLTNYIGGTQTSDWGTQNLYNIYGMGTPITGYGPPNDYTVLIGCKYDKVTGTANSCNLDNLGSTAAYDTCCGCAEWTSIATPNTPCGGGSPYWPGVGTNLLWTTDTPSQATVSYTIQEAVTWLKAACPTAYAYQFDDTASSFQCNTDGSTSLLTSYQITFCPGGVNALPAGGYTDGRGITP